MHKIPFFTLARIPEAIQREIEQSVLRVIRSGELSHGKNCQAFEINYAEKTGYKYCSLVSSGTDALLIIALYRKKYAVLNRVFVPGLSFIATLAPSILMGGELNFVDVDNTGNMDIDELLKFKLTSEDLIIPVSLYGNVVDLKRLREIAPNSHICHDSSQVAGGNLDGKSFSNYVDSEAQSLYITKCLAGITEGGCILTNDKKLYDFAVSFRNHGRDGNNYEYSQLGLNCRNSEINGAVLSTKLPYLDMWNDERIQIARRYKNNFAGNPNIKIPELNQSNKNVYHLFPIWVSPEKRDKTRENLEKLGIGTGKHYCPSLPDQKVFGEKYKDLYPNSRKLAASVICLPIWNGLTENEVDYVSENVLELVEQ